MSAPAFKGGQGRTAEEVVNQASVLWPIGIFLFLFVALAVGATS